MKILAVGDFHGKFPSWIPKVVKKEKIDIVVSNGDYFPFLKGDLWFKSCYGKDVEFWEVIGKKEYKEIILKEVKGAEKVFKGLNKLKVPVITVLGNHDQSKTKKDFDVMDVKKRRGKRYWKWDWQDLLSPVLKKYENVKRFDYSYFKFEDYVFIGMNGHSFPGKVKSKNYKKHRKKLDDLFHKFRNSNIVFVSHNVPYETKLDKINSKDAPESVRGKHYGSKLARRIIDRYGPVLHLAGHIHENQGKQKLGKTICVNTGGAHDGEGAIVEIKGKKVKVKFVN